MTPAPGWRPRVALALVVFALFFPSLWFTQSGYDDHWLWAEDSPLRHLDGDVLHHIWFELDVHQRRDVGTEYLPVRDMLTAADMALWGTSYRGPHATQLLLYIASVLSLFGLLARWRIRPDVAWLATLLWAIHPLHVEAVGWVSERKGILAGLFVFALGHAWIRYRDARSAGWLAAAVLASVAATWSKAPAMFAFAAFAAWDVLVLEAHRRRWILTFGVGAATALAALPVLIVARGGGVVDSAIKVAHDSRPVASLGALGHYALGVIGVRAPSLSYPIQTDGATPLDLAVGAGVIALALALWFVRRWPALAARRMVIAWAVVMFVPISHLLVRVHIAAADRYVYLWILAPCVGAAALLRMLRGPVRLAATAGLAGLFIIGSVRAEEAWTGRVALWEHAFATNPRDAAACQNLAETMYFYTQFPEALAVIERGLAAAPDEPAYLYGVRAAIYDAMRDRDRALEASARAAESGHASLLHEHGLRLLAAKRPAEALSFAERAADRYPSYASYAWLRITLLAELGRFAEAEVHARALVARFPTSASYMVMARMYAKWGKRDLVELHLTTARVLGAYASAVEEVRRNIGRPDADVMPLPPPMQLPLP